MVREVNIAQRFVILTSARETDMQYPAIITRMRTLQVGEGSGSQSLTPCATLLCTVKYFS